MSSSRARCTQQNIVCMQNPKSGQTILPGGTVSIFTQPTTTAVPDVVGLDQTTACNRLGQAGFQCGTITSQAVAVGGEEQRHQHQPRGGRPGTGRTPT